MKGRLEYPEIPPKRMLSANTEGYLYALDYLAHRMPADEKRQHMLVLGADPDGEDYNPYVARRGFINIEGQSFYYVGDDGVPVAAGGFAFDPMMPGVWQSWMVGTEDGWNRYWRDLTKGTRWLMGALLAGGARRLETTVLASRTEAQRWYTDFLGMKYEGARRNYFTNGEDLLLYSFTQQDWVNRLGGDQARETPLKEAA